MSVSFRRSYTLILSHTYPLTIPYKCLVNSSYVLSDVNISFSHALPLGDALPIVPSLPKGGALSLDFKVLLALLPQQTYGLIWYNFVDSLAFSFCQGSKNILSNLHILPRSIISLNFKFMSMEIKNPPPYYSKNRNNVERNGYIS